MTKSHSASKKIGLVLTGGGARSAYQAGAVCAILEFWPGDDFPFQIICGSSGGAINGAFFASVADRFRDGVKRLWDIWWNLQLGDVFKATPDSIGRIAVRLLKDLAFGGLLHNTSSNFLLDTAPLRELLAENIDFQALSRNLDSGVLHGLAITSTNFHSGTAVMFYDGDPSIQDWIRTNRLSHRTKITLDHVMGSAAVPIFFPPIKIQNAYFGDGSIRLNTPLSPAIHLGADKILAIGIRSSRSLQKVIELNIEKADSVTLAEIGGVMLNATFLDALDADLERMERMNLVLKLLGEHERNLKPDGMRLVETHVLRPSKDLGLLASQQFEHFPVSLRYLFRGLGASKERGLELESYFSFHHAYTSRLLELGYQDAYARKEQILKFMLDDNV